MSVKHPKPASIPDDFMSDDDWDSLEATEQFSSEVATALSTLGAKYQLHTGTAFSLAAGVAISMLNAPNGG